MVDWTKTPQLLNSKSSACNDHINILATGHKYKIYILDRPGSTIQSFKSQLQQYCNSTTQLYKTCVTLVAGQLDHLTFSCCGDIYWCRPTRVAGLATKVVINQFAKIYCPQPPHSTPVDGTHNIYSTQ